MAVISMGLYVKKKERMYHYLTMYCDFQKETLDLLTYNNLCYLAQDYGFNGAKV